MRRFILLIGVLSALGTILIMKLMPPKADVTLPNPRYAPSAINEKIVKNVQDFTVLISNESLEGVSRGTGILVDSMTVLTCAHVLGEDHSAKDMWIYPYPGAQVVHAKVRFVNIPNDLALLTLTIPVVGHKIPAIAKNVETGEPIIVVGNIKGSMLWFVSYGIISGEHERWVLTDATIRGGNSGGPWTNARGEIVALTDVGWSDVSGHETGISGGVPAEAIVKFLAQANAKKPSLVYALTGE